MLESLLPYYERELGHLRQLSGEFARRYPKIVGRHQLRGEYLFLMPAAGMDLELEKKPATP